VTEFTS